MISPTSETVQSLSTLELAQALAERLAITPADWHRLKANRQAQASQHLGSALVFLLSEQPDLALQHINQAAGWLDRSLTAPPCPSHGHKHT
jgi:hypothetical protein